MFNGGTGGRAALLWARPKLEPIDTKRIVRIFIRSLLRCFHRHRRWRQRQPPVPRNAEQGETEFQSSDLLYSHCPLRRRLSCPL